MDSFDKISKNTPPDVKKFVSKSLDIVDYIHAILKDRGKGNIYLADLLNKNESEISKWLTGLHNLTIKSITKMEVALKRDIIVPYSALEKAQRLSKEEKKELLEKIHHLKDQLRLLKEQNKKLEEENHLKQKR